jgi:hypothetical protein
MARRRDAKMGSYSCAAPKMVDKATAAVAREGINGFFWGHAGDGNPTSGSCSTPPTRKLRQRCNG